MYNQRKRKILLFQILLLIFMHINTVQAASTGTLGINGGSNFYTGATFTLDMAVATSTGTVTTIGGKLAIDNASCVTLTNVVAKVSGGGGAAASKKIYYMDTEGKAGAFAFVTATFTAGSTPCTATISIQEGTLSFMDGTDLENLGASKTVTIGNAPSADNNLKSLVPSIGSLTPNFAPGTTSYTINLDDTQASATTMTFTAAANDAKATVSAPACTLTATTTACQIRVTAESGAVKTYTVNVKKPVKSNDATLKSLTPNVGTLSPAFAPATTTYTMEVNDEVNSITFTGVPNNAAGKIISGANCDLTAGLSCPIVVQAEDGTKKTYTVNVTKKKEVPVVSSDKTLASLEVTGYKLDPEFDKEKTSYFISVPNDINDLDIKAIPTHAKATAAITGGKDLKEGMNTVAITVTAEDGTKQIYSINVYKEPKTPEPTPAPTPEAPKPTPKSSDNFLKSLIVSNGELKPAFDKNTSSYNITVPSDVNKLDINYITSDKKAKVKILGNDNLKPGLNTVTVEVTAEDGTVRFYMLNVLKSEIESNNKLKELSVDGYTIRPGFIKEVFSYDVTVPYNVNDINVKALAENPNAKVEIIGDKNLQEGNNAVLVKVTDENGFVQYYTVNVKKEAKKEKTFLGLPLRTWLLIGAFATIIGLLLLLLAKRKKKQKPTKIEQNIEEKQAPVIEFKPEFNFGSKNGTDDDYVESGGVLNQSSGIKEEPKISDYIPEAEYFHKPADRKAIPYDPYDETVTKDELVDAIHEALSTKDPAKLKMLLDQDNLNKRKKALKAEEKRKKGYYD